MTSNLTKPVTYINEDGRIQATEKGILLNKYLMELFSLGLITSIEHTAIAQRLIDRYQADARKPKDSDVFDVPDNVKIQ